MERKPGTSWNSVCWMYSPEYKQIFFEQVEEIVRQKGDCLKYTDFNSIDLIHPGRHEGVDLFIEEHSVSKPAKVIEVGPGLGGTSRHLSEYYGFQVESIEFLPHFVECTNLVNSVLSISNKVSQGDITAHPIPKETYDVAIAIVVFMYVQNESGIKNLAKALKPGGLFYLEDYYFVKDENEWDENDIHNIEARGMCGVRTKAEYRRILDEADLDIIEESEFGKDWSIAAWDRAEKMLEEGAEEDPDPHSHYHQYVHVSPQVTCDLNHLTPTEAREKYRELGKILDVEDIIFTKKKLSSIWRVVARKREN